MGKGAKLLLGLGLGLLVVFAAIGIKSMMGNKPMQVPDTGSEPVVPEGSLPLPTQPPATSPATDPNLSQQDTGAPQGTNKLDVTLEGEPDAPKDDEQNAPNTPDQTTTPNDPNQQNNTNTTQTTTQTPATTTGTSTQVGMSGTTNTDMPTPTQDPAQVADSYGKLTIQVTDPSSGGRSVEGDFLVYDNKGLQVASLSGGDSASFDLAPGEYKVNVSANGKQSSRQLSVYTDKLTTARFELPSTPATTQQPSAPVVPDKIELDVSVRAASSNTPLKANIYVQTTNGRHIARKDYDDMAEFLLDPGVYRVTVKAKGHQDASRDVRVGTSGTVRESFELQPIGGATTSIQAPTQQQRPTPTPAPSQTVNQGAVLRLSLSSGIGLPDKAQFTVRDMNGNRIANVGPVGNTELKLPAGRYEVTASFDRSTRETRTVDLVDGRASQVSFSADGILQQSGNPDQNNSGRDWGRNRDRGRGDVAQAEPQAGGVLQLKAVSGVDGRPLRVNFVVSTMQGELVRTFNNVSYGEVAIPPQDVRVEIHYEDMNGSEIITVKPDSPTLYTFTISPKQQRQQPQQQEPQMQQPMQFPMVQPPPGVDADTMRQIQEEIQRRLTN